MQTQAISRICRMAFLVDPQPRTKLSLPEMDIYDWENSGQHGATKKIFLLNIFGVLFTLNQTFPKYTFKPPLYTIFLIVVLLFKSQEP